MNIPNLIRLAADRVILTISALLGTSQCELKAIRLEQVRQRALLQKIVDAVISQPVASIGFDVQLGGKHTTGAKNVQLTDSQKFDFTITPLDAKGAAASIDPTKTTAALDNTSVGSVTINADGLSGSFVAAGIGSAQLTVTVTDAVDATDTVTGTLSIVVVAGSTASFTINPTAPVAQ